MKTRYRIVEPDEVVCEMTIQMTLGQWRLIKKELGGSHAVVVSNFHSAICAMIDKAEKEIFDSKKGVKEDIDEDEEEFEGLGD